FERNFNEREAREWMRQNWHVTLFFAVVYMIVIFGIQRYMKQREGFSLRAPLALWSFGLAALSTVASVRLWKHTLFIFSTKGLKQTVCGRSIYVHPMTKLWIFLFVATKFVELGDTMFIVLRKKPLIFLHWYHHAATLMISWYSYKEMAAGGTWPTVLNFSVHSIMYSYYTVKAMGYNVPRLICMAITSMQMLQMVMYIIMNVLLIIWKDEKECPTTWTFLFHSWLLSTTLLVLFVNYFLKTYLRDGLKSKRE
ncbi:ELOV6 protein, partial [Urocolius indicus]|nr:ELOV6 protein [Urocolius indicus]